MTIVPVRRLSRQELLWLGHNTHAAARRDPDQAAGLDLDDPLFAMGIDGESDLDPSIDAVFEDVRDDPRR